jgi:hypothetical protein
MDEYQYYWYAGATFNVIKLEFGATKTCNISAKLECAGYNGYSVEKEDTTPAIRNEFKAKNAPYVQEREEKQRAREAPMVAVSSGRF